MVGWLFDPLDDGVDEWQDDWAGWLATLPAVFGCL